MTPGVASPYPDVTPIGGGGVSREGSEVFPPVPEDDGGEDDELGPRTDEPEGEAETEASLIKRLTMQNLFAPGAQPNSFTSSTENLTRAIGEKVMNWGMAASSVPATPSIAAVKTGEGMATDMASLQVKYGASLPVIHNVVATANLGCLLDLKTIAMAARNAEYNPRRFSAVIMRIREPKSTALVFKSGKLVVTGTKSEADARHPARKFGRVIKKVGYNQVVFRDFHVENLVSTFNVPFPIHLEQLYRSLPNQTHSQYEPEVFPGLICRAKKGTLLIFVSGKCVMIGMKTKTEIEDAYTFILPWLEKYRKK